MYMMTGDEKQWLRNEQERIESFKNDAQSVEVKADGHREKGRGIATMIARLFQKIAIPAPHWQSSAKSN